MRATAKKLKQNIKETYPEIKFEDFWIPNAQTSSIV
jgi:hypothetical protein